MWAWVCGCLCHKRYLNGDSSRGISKGLAVLVGLWLSHKLVLWQTMTVRIWLCCGWQTMPAHRPHPPLELATSIKLSSRRAGQSCDLILTATTLDDDSGWRHWGTGWHGDNKHFSPPRLWFNYLNCLSTEIENLSFSWACGASKSKNRPTDPQANVNDALNLARNSSHTSLPLFRMAQIYYVVHMGGVYMPARYVQFHLATERVKAKSKTNQQQTVYLRPILCAKNSAYI